MDLTHVNSEGRAKMVSVSAKEITERRAVAQAVVNMLPETLVRIENGGIKKGDVLAVAQVAGIMAAKKTFDVIPMCHNVPVSGCDLSFERVSDVALKITAVCETAARTGVEMEALTAVSVAALTVYDMCKAIDRGMRITDVMLLEKSGGTSGEYKRV